MADAVILIDALLEELGYGAPEARRLARAAIEAAGLTNPRKQNIAVEKREAVRAVLEDRLARLCGDDRCIRLAADDLRPRVLVDRASCQVCGGSPNATAVSAMAETLIEAGRPRLLVVGGSPNAHTELRLLLGGTPVELRIVDGTMAVTEKRADAWADWADVIVVWGGTQLGHRVSEHFLDPALGSKRLTVVQRGIAALADAVVTHVRGTARASSRRG